MALSDRFLRLATLVTTLCTVVVTTVILRREFFPRRASPPQPKSIPQQEWQELLRSGRRIGPANAQLTIVEFVDFECPACAAFSKTIRKFRQAYPGQVAIVYQHLPLSIHESALPLARASECAAHQGHFEAFHDSVFAHQKLMLGLPMSTIGRKIGVPDTVQYDRCLTDSTMTLAVDRGLQAAERIQAKGTPTILIRGKMYRQIVDSALLASLLK